MDKIIMYDQYPEVTDEVEDTNEPGIQAIEAPRQQLSSKASLSTSDQEVIPALNEQEMTLGLSFEQQVENLYPVVDEAEEEKDQSWWTNKKDLTNKQYHKLIDYEKDQEENWALKALRYASNVGVGYINKYPAVYGANLATMVLGGASDLIMDEMAENDPDLALDIAKKASRKWIGYIPTQEFIWDVVEKYTGFPIEPKNELQALLRVGFMAGSGRPSWAGTVGHGTAVPIISKALRELDMQGEHADTIALLASSVPDAAIGVAKAVFGEKKAKAFSEMLFGKKPPSQPPPPGAPPGAPPTYQQTSESIAAELAGRNTVSSGPVSVSRLEVPLAETRSQGGRSLRGRATEGAADTGFRPSAANPTVLKEQITQTFTPNRFRNKSDRGVATATEIRAQDNAAYRGVEQAYEESRALNSALPEERIDSFIFINQEIERLGVPVPGSAQAAYLSDLRSLAPQIEAQVSNQFLIEKIQQLNKKRSYNFEHGDSMNIYSPLIDNLSDSVERGTGLGNMEALDAWRVARAKYSTWATTFNNKYVRPFRNTKNHDYEKLSKDLLSTDKFNQVSHALESSPRGQQILNEARGTIAETRLSKFAKNPRTNNQADFDQALNELQSVAGITPANIDSIRSDFRNAKGNLDFRATYDKPVTATQEHIATYMRKHPSGSGEMIPWEGSKIKSMMDDPEGIRMLRTELNKTKTGEQLFALEAKHEVKNMMTDGNLSKEFTGSDLARIMNKEKNFSKFAEIYGYEEASKIREIALQLGKEHMRREKVLKFTKDVATLKIIKDLKDFVP